MVCSSPTRKFCHRKVLHIARLGLANSPSQFVSQVNKDGPALGLTISDNGAGYAFIKKVREDSIMSRVKNCEVGDHIQAINGSDLTGCRHFEVARMLKEIPIGSEFTMTCVEPKKAFEAIAPRGQLAAPATDVKANAGRKTLRMRTNAAASVEEEFNDDSQTKINKIEEMLEQHVGIRDMELSSTLFDLAKAAKEVGILRVAYDVHRFLNLALGQVLFSCVLLAPLALLCHPDTNPRLPLYF